MSKAAKHPDAFDASAGSLPLDQIICGDNCEIMRQMPSGSIDLVVTSPPYDDLRTYGGHSWDFYGVAWNLRRLLKPGGVIVWVVADQTKDGSETGTSMRQALHFQSIGMNLHDTMIYMSNKPPLTHRRYEQSWEYSFVVSKGKPATFHPLMRKTSTAGGLPGRFMQNAGDSTYSVAHKKSRTGDETYRPNAWYYHAGSDRTNGEHPAPFPEALARDHILSWSNHGDVVLDPFSGSGTTAKMARETGRHYIGIEVNPEYVEISRKRLAQQALPMDVA
jgi:DNA modification methylase